MSSRFITAWGLIAAGAALSLAGCNREQEVAPDAPVNQLDPIGDVIGLPDDSSLVAVPGSPERALATFLASDHPAPQTFRFGGDQFQPWSAEPNAQTRATTAALIQILRAYPKVKVKVLGFTDSVGGVEANQKLSDERVAYFKQLLVDGGIDDDRIAAIGMGMANPIGDDTPAGRARNRRLELVVTEK